MSIPADLKFSKSHEWIRVEGKVATIGITHWAQDQLGDVVFWDGPTVGDSFAAGDSIGVVESVKAVNDVYTPVSGTVTEVNDGLEDAPENVNSDPYGEGWMIKLELTGSDELADLLSSSDYEAMLADL